MAGKQLGREGPWGPRVLVDKELNTGQQCATVDWKVNSLMGCIRSSAARTSREESLSLYSALTRHLEH